MDTRAIPDDLLKPGKAARLVGVHPATLYRWILHGRLRAWRTPTARYMVSRADVLGFMKTMPGIEEKPAGEASPVKVGAGQLTELAIDGDTATGKLDGEPVRFVRENGRWFFEAEAAPAGPEAEPEPAAAAGG